MDRLVVLAIVALVVVELLARAAGRVSNPDVLRRRLEPTPGAMSEDQARAREEAARAVARVQADQAESAASVQRRAAQSGKRRSARPTTAPESSRQEYLGSMGHRSGEGESAMYVADHPDDDAAWRPLGEPAAASDGLALPSVAREAGAIGMALRTLGDSSQAAQGAGAAIVLAEILGPPRAKSVRRPSAPQARWR